MATVSVVIPAWGETPWLEAAEASVRRQIHRAIELIVAAPPEGGPQTALAARMDGVRRATGDYVTFVDADDWLDDDAIASLVDAIGEAEVVCAGLVRNSGERLPSSDIWECGPSDVFNAMYGKLYRRELFADLDLDLSIRLGEDLMVVAQILHRANSIRVLPKALYHYRDNPGSVTHRQEGRGRVEDLAKVGAILRKRLPEPTYAAFHDRVTRDAMLLMLRHRVFDRSLWRELRGRLSSPLLSDPRHGIIKKGALACAGCILD